jgi:hypothetical protein
MSTSGVFSIGAAALALALGCSGGDLTLPSADGPGTLVVVSGDGQEAEAGTMLEDPLTVELLDASSQPMRDVLVEFSFVGDLPGAGLSPATVLTDEEGRAEAVVRLGEVVGDQVIVAQVANTESAGLRASFLATAVAPDDDGGGGGGGGKKDKDRGRGSGSDGDGDDDD